MSITKAERARLRDWLSCETEPYPLDRAIMGRLLDALDAAETERDELRQIAEGCCNATDGGCTPGVSIEFLRLVPKEIEFLRVSLKAQRDRAEAELDVERKLRVAAEEHTAMEMADLADVERMAWEALGKPDGTHETSNVQRLCEAFAAMQSAIAHAAAQFDVSDEKRAEDAPISAEVHFREAVRTIARTLPSSTRAVDRGAIWGELREMDRLHIDNAKLAADLAAAEAAINALDCHYGATEELGHDCHDASPCMRERLEAARDEAVTERDEAKAKLAALTGVVLRLRNDMGAIVFGDDIDTVEDAIAAARGGASVASNVDTAPPQSAEMLALRAEVARLRKELAAALDDLRTWRGMCLNAREALRRPDLAQDDDDDGCPVGDPECLSRSDECHTACEAPKGPACGHSACSQHHIDTGSAECVEGDDGN